MEHDTAIPEKEKDLNVLICLKWFIITFRNIFLTTHSHP